MQLYGLNLSNTEINKLMNMVGGHPYLINLAISNLVSHPQESLTEI